MTREEFQTERTRIISEMLDNPDEYGIFPTTKCFEQLDALFDSLSLPPAEGAESAEAFIKRKHPQDWDEIPQWHIDELNEFAAQQQPTAEGAEENVIYHNLTQPFRRILQSVALHGYDIVFAERDCVKCATDFATLHAQRIADKMVSERLREELIAYDKWVINREGMGGGGINVEQDVDIYLKSREK